MDKKTPGFQTISLERSLSFGECPVYKMIISENGVVEFNGEKFVDGIGLHQWQISQENIDALKELITDFKFYHYKYPEVSDSIRGSSGVVIKVHYNNGYRKRIYHYLGHKGEGFEKLCLFEDKIDELSENGNFKSLGNKEA